MTKELIAAWGVEFDPVNVEGNKEALEELVLVMGVPLVPAVVYEGRVVHGWNPGGVAKLLGVPFSDVPKLAPPALAKRLDGILARVQQAARAMPAAKLGVMGGGRNRTFFQLAFHACRVAATFVDSLEQDGLEEGWLQEEAPDEFTTGEDLARYGERVRERLRAWFGAAQPAVFAEAVATYYGEQSAHSLLERTTWHSGQHLRQLSDLMAREGVPGTVLEAGIFSDLPMPKAVW